MDYTMDESKRILIIEKEATPHRMKPETGGGATNTPGEGEIGDEDASAKAALDGLCSEKLVDLVFILATKLDRNVDDMRSNLNESHVTTDERFKALEERVAQQVGYQLNLERST